MDPLGLVHPPRVDEVGRPATGTTMEGLEARPVRELLQARGPHRLSVPLHLLRREVGVVALDDRPRARLGQVHHVDLALVRPATSWGLTGPPLPRHRQ
eukprot:14314036-Alexandrium_andersonii.AAC.1